MEHERNEYSHNIDRKLVELSTIKNADHNFDPKVLHAIRSDLNLSLWQIISNYAETIKTVTFDRYNNDKGLIESGTICDKKHALII
jgi:hypothetical protein